MTATSAAAAHQRWQKERHAYVTGPTGNLALVSYQPVTAEPAPVEGIPVHVRLAEHDGAWVTPHADGVTVDGRPLQSEELVPRLRSDGTPIVAFGRLAFDVFSLDGTDHELRIYDQHAEPLSRFDHIATWPYDATLAIPGRFHPYDAARDVPWDFTRSADTGHAKRVPGEVSIHIGNATYRLLAFIDGDTLVLVFADSTTGSESYAPGRFLRLPKPDTDGNIEVDFNRSFVPPCGFSNSYSCPLPPPQNRIAEPLRAGEQRVVWRTP